MRPAVRTSLVRLGWFVGLWLASVMAVGAVALIIRAWLR